MENEEHTIGTGKVVLAALGGAVVGAAVTLLVAPQSGKETRRQITGYVDTAKETLTKIPGAFKDASQAAKSAAKDALSNGGHHPHGRHASKT